MAEDAARKALTLLDAVDAPTGRLPVVVGNGFGGVLLHEAVGHGLEADAVQKQASVYAGRLGEQLAERGVTAYDDGAKANAWGSDGIDDEGTPTRRTTVIEDGELVSYLYDRQSAHRDGVASTGNGRRQSFRHLPIPRMTNTYFAPGEASADELIASIDRGLYAVSFGGGQVEPATGDFVFGVCEGYLIEAGKVTAPVRGATLVGNGLQALAAVDGIASDLEIATGYCGKAGQSVPGGRGPAARAHPRADRGRHRLSELEAIAQAGVEAALAAGAGEAEAWVESSTSRQIRVYDGEVESLSDSGGRGIGIRAFIDGRTGYAYGTDLEPAGLRSVAERAHALAAVADRDEHAGLPDQSGTTAVDGLASAAMAEWDTERKVALALEVDRAARSRSGVSQVENTVYSDGEGTVAIANSRGFAASSAATQAWAYSSAFAGQRRGPDDRHGHRPRARSRRPRPRGHRARSGRPRAGAGRRPAALEPPLPGGAGRVRGGVVRRLHRRDALRRRGAARALAVRRPRGPGGGRALVRAHRRRPPPRRTGQRAVRRRGGADPAHRR